MPFDPDPFCAVFLILAESPHPKKETIVSILIAAVGTLLVEAYPLVNQARLPSLGEFLAYPRGGEATSQSQPARKQSPPSGVMAPSHFTLVRARR